MAQWNHTLDIADAWKKADNEEITSQELATHVLVKFKSLKLGKNYEESKSDVMEQLESFVENPTADKDDFDNVMAEVYDLADAARIWVKIN